MVDFEKLIDFCNKNNQYIGIGNPNAKILFVGKEPGINKKKSEIHGSWESWKDNLVDFSKRFVPPVSLIPEDNKIRSYSHTWQRYQKLYEMIVSDYDFEKLKAKEKYEITFVENVFTTELNNLYDISSDKAKKQEGFSSNIKNRKEVFFKTDFIQKFPIVIIAACDNKYIETYPGEVCELFNVEFSKEITCGKSGKIWIHYAAKGKSKNHPKLVIHTRQLTNGASDELVFEIAKVVKEFINNKDNNIQILVK